MLGGVIEVSLWWRLVVVASGSGFRGYNCIRYCIAMLVLVSIQSGRVSNDVSLFCDFN